MGMTTEQVLYDVSYTNAIMYSRTVPTYSGKKDDDNDKKPLYDDSLDANDVSKFNDFDEEEIVKV